MRIQSFSALFVLLMAPLTVEAQSVLKTVLGATPDGLSALKSSLNTPAAVAAAPDGSVYVATKIGRQVVRIDTAGVVHLVAGTGNQGSTGDGGPATAATLNMPVSLALDSAGNLYVCDSAASRVRRIAADGTISTVNTGTLLSGPTGIAVDNSGNLLIADTGNHIVRIYKTDGTLGVVAGTGVKGNTGDGGDARSALLTSPGAVAVDSSGNIFIADTGNAWIRKVTTAGVISRYGGVDSTSRSPFGGGDPTLAVNTTLYTPTSIAVDLMGNVYFVESAAPRVKRITTDGHIASYAGTGLGGSSGDSGLARFANLNVLGICVDNKNNLYIADGINHRVREVTIADGIINTIAGDGVAAYSARGMALNGDYLYYSDSANNIVRRYNLKTGELTRFAGSGKATFSGDKAAASVAALSDPRGLAFDKSGNLYIADSGNNRVRKVDTSGIITTYAGDGTAATDGNLGQATVAGINQPVAVAIDDSGNLYIAERTGNVIRKVTSGGIISTVAGTGTAGTPSAETGVATSQRLYWPAGLAIQSDGSLLIADSGNSRIRRLTTDGTITTVAGSKSAGDAGDGGAATSAVLKNPTGVGIDASGNIYIADTANSRVRLVGTDGIITTVAGTGVQGFNGDGSPATSYTLHNPAAIVPTSSCSAYIADTENKRIRLVQTAVDYTITTNPAGLQVTVDGQSSTTPAVFSFLPGTHHTVSAPSPQSAGAGTQYVPAAAQSFDVACGAPRAAVKVAFTTQYALTVAADAGGSVTSVAPWQTSGASVTLNATPQSGYVFSGWAGDCSGTGACTVVMSGPKSVIAHFQAAQ